MHSALDVVALSHAVRFDGATAHSIKALVAVSLNAVSGAAVPGEGTSELDGDVAAEWAATAAPAGSTPPSWMQSP